LKAPWECNPNAKRGHSRHGRPDCLQAVVALVVITDGFPLAYEVMKKNTTGRRSGCARWTGASRPKRSWPGCATRPPGLLSGGDVEKEDQTATPGARQEVTHESFHFRVDKARLKEAELRDGHYLLRSNLTGGDPSVLWSRYVQPTEIESVFRSLKSEFGLRPIRHQLEHRADVHILIASA
jgi:hypothetical protein